MQQFLIKDSKKKRNSQVVENYKHNLNYGTIAINEWAAIAFIIPTMPWGGYPGIKITTYKVVKVLSIIHSFLNLH